MSKILERWGRHIQYQQYLPIAKELKAINKQFIVNVAYSVIGEEFREWVKDLVHERNDDITKKKQLMINMDPEIAKAFSASTAVSSKCRLSLSASFRALTVVSSTV